MGADEYPRDDLASVCSCGRHESCSALTSMAGVCERVCRWAERLLSKPVPPPVVVAGVVFWSGGGHDTPGPVINSCQSGQWQRNGGHEPGVAGGADGSGTDRATCGFTLNKRRRRIIYIQYAGKAGKFAGNESWPAVGKCWYFFSFRWCRYSAGVYV